MATHEAAMDEAAGETGRTGAGERDAAALVTAFVVVGAAALVAIAALAAVLGAVGLWAPLVVWPAVALVLAGCALLSRRLLFGARALTGPRLGPVPAVALLTAVAGVTVWLGATHADQALPRRDAGSNLQAAISLATEHRRIVPVDTEAIGGSKTLEREGIRLGSPAFYQVGDLEAPAIQPQFPIGPAAVYSLGWWIGGPAGAQWLAPLTLAIALLGLGLLAARWAGPWAAPPVAALAGLAFPIAHSSRSTYSEPLALATLVGGMLLFAMAVGQREAGQRAAGSTVRLAALLGGILVGGTVLHRADGLREVVLATVACGLLLIQGRRETAGPFLVGAWVSTVLGFVALLALSPRYLGDIAGSLVPLAGIALAAGAGTAALVVLARRGRRLPASLSRALPTLALVLPVLLAVHLWSRPFWQIVRQDPNDPGARVVAGLQLAQGLPVDGGRTYAEQTVAWLTWWVGPLALSVVVLACAIWCRRVAQTWNAGTHLPEWTVPLAVAVGSTVLTLIRPGITPDHPWAERRLVIATAMVVLVVVVAAADLLRNTARRWSPAVGSLPALFLVLATSIVVWRGTAPHLDERIEAGSSQTVAEVCAALRPGDVVVAVDSRAVNEWPQVVRGSCGRPALVTTGALRKDTTTLRETLREIAADLPDGSRLIALAADGPDSLTDAVGRSGEPVGVRVVREDQRLLEEIPDSTEPLTIGAWLTPIAPAGG